MVAQRVARSGFVATCMGLLSVLILTGCTAPVALTPKELTLPSCDGISTPIPVEELTHQGLTKCDLGGFQMIFPDGFTFTPSTTIAKEQTSGSETGSSSGTVNYFWANLGIYGVVASVTKIGGKTQWWGTPTAIQKKLKSLG